MSRWGVDRSAPSELSLIDGTEVPVSVASAVASSPSALSASTASDAVSLASVAFAPAVPLAAEALLPAVSLASVAFALSSPAFSTAASLTSAAFSLAASATSPTFSDVLFGGVYEPAVAHGSGRSLLRRQAMTAAPAARAPSRRIHLPLPPFFATASPLSTA